MEWNVGMGAAGMGRDGRVWRQARKMSVERSLDGMNRNGKFWDELEKLEKTPC